MLWKNLNEFFHQPNSLNFTKKHFKEIGWNNLKKKNTTEEESRQQGFYRESLLWDYVSQPFSALHWPSRYPPVTLPPLSLCLFLLPLTDHLPLLKPAKFLSCLSLSVISRSSRSPRSSPSHSVLFPGNPFPFFIPLLLLLSCFSRVQLCATPRWQPTRLPRPWDSPGKNTGVGCHLLLQCMKVKSESEVDQSSL